VLKNLDWTYTVGLKNLSQTWANLIDSCQWHKHSVGNCLLHGDYRFAFARNTAELTRIIVKDVAYKAGEMVSKLRRTVVKVISN
jgi:hypothetical protein